MRSLLVLCVAAVLAVVAAGAICIAKWPGCSVELARHVAVSSSIDAVSALLEAHKNRRGDYPTSLRVLIDEQAIDGTPLDPWRNEFVYRSPGLKNRDGFDLFSAGPDRIPDTADDD